jgi:hypothetical protein
VETGAHEVVLNARAAGEDGVVALHGMFTDL